MKRGADREGHEILPTKRKAIRAALLSGVKPVQVAKHFGVSLTTVRQISTGQR
jgi:DNA-directed RNA polymerase specialized sigma24 family protein